jgi:putative methyltransferase (TIGR04325 family)
MEFIQKIFKKLKYIILIINYKFFISKKIKNYNNLVLNESIIKKTILFNKLKSKKKYDINFTRTVRFLEFLKKKKLKNIIDFGGGAGYHYFIAKKKLTNFKLKWLVIENRTMVKLCNKKIRYKDLYFSNSFKKIKENDVFFSSCSLNYTKNPSKTIKSIIKLNTKYLYFTRTPLTQGSSFKYKQISLLSDNGPCKIKNEKQMLCEYENKILNQQNFEDMFKNKFVIISKYIDEKNVFFNLGRNFDTYTYIMKKI